jgi:hypothetical protein
MQVKADSLLAKEEILESKVGRPKILYKPTEKLLEGFRTKINPLFIQLRDTI